MPTKTPGLNLEKINPETDGDLAFDIERYLNGNWDKVDVAVTSHKSAEVLDHPDGSVTDAKLGNRTVDQATATAYGNTGSLTQIMSWFAKVIKGITGKANWFDTPVTTLEAANTHMTDTTGVHGATSSPTASKLMIRDASGRAQVAAPLAAADIARKDTVDAVQTSMDSHKAAAVLDHPDGSVTDAKLGNRTVDQATTTAYGNTGSLTQILSWFAKIFIGITGKANWFDTPATTLEAANMHMSAVAAHGILAYRELDASSSLFSGTRKPDALCWSGQCIYGNTPISGTAVLTEVIIDTLRFCNYTLVVRLKSANNTMATDAIKIDVLKNVSGTFTSISSRLIKANEFPGTTDYKCFYLQFEYKGQRAANNQIKVAITLQTQAAAYEVDLDSIVIAPMVIAAAIPPA